MYHASDGSVFRTTITIGVSCQARLWGAIVFHPLLRLLLRRHRENDDSNKSHPNQAQGNNVFQFIGDAVARARRCAALRGLAGLLILVGMGFFTAALWRYLVAVFGPVQAALMSGLGYVGTGLVCTGVLKTSG